MTQIATIHNENWMNENDLMFEGLHDVSCTVSVNQMLFFPGKQTNPGQ